MDARVGHDRQKLVEAWPWDGPGCPAFRQLRQAGIRGLVLGRILSVGEDEQVGVNGNHAPRPS